MAYFNRDNRSGDRRGSFRKNDFGGGRGGDREMFDAVCNNCGKQCRVPFRPTEEKPVYCSECFEKMGGRNDSRSSDRPRYDSRNRDERPAGNDKLDSIVTKLDRIIALLETISTPKTKKATEKETSSKEE